jgi:hypothetical protein
MLKYFHISMLSYINIQYIPQPQIIEYQHIIRRIHQDFFQVISALTNSGTGLILFPLRIPSRALRTGSEDGEPAPAGEAEAWDFNFYMFFLSSLCAKAFY